MCNVIFFAVIFYGWPPTENLRDVIYVLSDLVQTGSFFLVWVSDFGQCSAKQDERLYSIILVREHMGPEGPST